MTNANTPTTREREAAREIVWQRICRFEELEYGKTPDISNRETCLSFYLEKAEIDAIAAALARERREAQAEQMERDCKVVCEYCESGHEVRYKAWDMPAAYDFGHWAMDDESADFQWVKCEAHNIRAAAIEAMRE